MLASSGFGAGAPISMAIGGEAIERPDGSDFLVKCDLAHTSPLIGQ